MSSDETVSSHGSDSDVSMAEADGKVKSKPTLQNGNVMFTAALDLNHSIKEQPGMKGPWPPTAASFGFEAVRSVVPVKLFNFIAWTVGASTDPALDEYVEVTSDVEYKILSLCQDVIYLAAKGRKQTPKSLSLGIATKHLTGSYQLIKLLNRLGHVASWDTVVSLDTSLAELQLTAGNDIPSDFSKDVPTVLVWDNIDFSEETLSGRGTTHHTNGIMIQPSAQRGETDRVISLKKGMKTLSKSYHTSLEPYFQNHRGTPTNVQLDAADLPTAQTCSVSLSTSLALEFLYVLLRHHDSNATIPGWTGFHCKLFPQLEVAKSAIHYMPMIEASPTEMATVQTILVRSLEQVQKLQLDHIVVVFDQAIYAKAQQIRWKDHTNEDMKTKLVVRLGEFHTSMSFLNIIGKRFGDGGLKDILIESEIVASGSINSVLNGHHYNRSMRAHKILYESLQQLRFKAFLQSLSEGDERDIQLLATSASQQFTKTEVFSEEKLNDISKLLEKYNNFIQAKSLDNPTFAFWSSYLEMMTNLLLFVSATRESDWKKHLSAVRIMLPWYFAYDHVNYARYLPAYWLEMLQLPQTHPQCHDQFLVPGQWTVQRSSHPFTSIACDQAIEQTVNKDSKTKGGMVGLTLNRNASQRWILSHHERSAITRRCEELAGIFKDVRGKKDCDVKRIAKERGMVSKAMETIESMMNPFENPPEGLANLSSGVTASAKVSADLLTAKEKGEAALTNFLEERLLTKNVDFYAPIKAMKLQTFSTAAKKSSKSLESKNKGNETLFRNLLVLGQKRKVDMKDTLSYSLGTVSFPLASSDGTLAKTNKAALVQVIEPKDTAQIITTTVPQNGTLVIDGMALIQGLRKTEIPATFDELAILLLKKVEQLASRFHCQRVDFVTDRYFDHSIKGMERDRRLASHGVQRIQIFCKSQKTPLQWQKFLSLGSNKTELVEFLFNSWKDLYSGPFDLFVAHENKCHLLSKHHSAAIEIQELDCDHEEADTRMFLHAQHAASTTNQHVLIKSMDTDVYVLCLAFSAQIGQLFLLTGTGNKSRIVNISVLATHLGTAVCNALIGIHIFSGCDSVSSFHGKGKRKAFLIAKERPEYLEAFGTLGNHFDIDISTFEVLEKFVCQLYNQGCECDLNSARYKVFCLSSTRLSPQTLPPTRDALWQHCKRAAYQAAVHRRSLMVRISAPSPEGHGWYKDGNELFVQWMDQEPMPGFLKNIVHCSCKLHCNSNRCSCKSNNVPCTDMCKCSECNNASSELSSQSTIQDDEDDVDSSDDENI